MNRIHLLSSTDRPGANALKVASHVNDYLKEAADTELFSLQDFPLQDVAGGRYGQKIESVDRFNEKFLNADGFIFVVPEYNGGFPGILKLFLDYLPFPEAMEKMPVSFVGEAAGSFGALRPIEHLQQILVYRKAIVYPERMFIQRVNKNFERETGIQSDKMEDLLKDQILGFIDFVNLVN